MRSFHPQGERRSGARPSAGGFGPERSRSSSRSLLARPALLSTYPNSFDQYHIVSTRMSG
jgi:hypothetical protein